jgi:hypothetical protein
MNYQIPGKAGNSPVKSSISVPRATSVELVTGVIAGVNKVDQILAYMIS